MAPKVRRNAGRMRAQVNERNRTYAEKRAHRTRMTAAVRNFLDNHFKNGGTLESLKNIDDPKRYPESLGQHDSISIIRLPIPATQDGLFVIKDLGSPLKTPYGNAIKNAQGNDTYVLQARDLWVEASAISFIGTHTDIPVPWIYTSCAADEESIERSFIAMEYVEGTAFRAGMTMTENQKDSVIRQLAAVRIRMIELTSQAIGGVNWPILPDGTPSTINRKDKHPAGVISGPTLWDDGRHQVRNSEKLDWGPYPSVRDFVNASFQKEVAYYTLNPKETTLSPDDIGKPAIWRDYIAALTAKLTKRQFSTETEFHLTHRDLNEGNNICFRGGKIVAIIDWETAAFLPFSEAIADLLPDADSVLRDGKEILKFMDPANFKDIGLEGTGRPTYRDWIDYREEEFGTLGSMQAWPQLKGTAATSSFRFTYDGNFSVQDFQDSDSEYSDGDEVERIAGDWWVDEVIPAVWGLVEQHISKYGINGVPYERTKMMWSDPVVATIGLNHLDPQERLFLA